MKRVLAIKNLKNGRTVSSTNNTIAAPAIVSPKILTTTLLDKCTNATFETKDVTEEQCPDTKKPPVPELSAAHRYNFSFALHDLRVEKGAELGEDNDR